MAKRSRRRTPRGDRPAAKVTQRHKGARRQKASPPVLLLILASDTATLERVVSVLIDLGIGSSVLDAHPLSSVLRSELPIFGALASLIPPSPDGRLLVSFTTADAADRAVRLLERRPQGAKAPLIATIALRSMTGL